jgi:hypothetical protein
MIVFIRYTPVPRRYGVASVLAAETAALVTFIACAKVNRAIHAAPG